MKRKTSPPKSVLDMPMLGLGTWQLQGKECTDVVSEALELGYRHIDTAHIYQNHKAIGKAIADYERNALFLTSKLPVEEIDSAHMISSVEKKCDAALKELGTDYLDLYLIHWPHSPELLPKVFDAMERLVEKGKVLNAGVSNFTIHHLEDLRKEKLHPMANQVEFHPYLNQEELLDYCASHGIRLIAYRPLGKKKLLDYPLFKQIGARYEKSAAQVLLRWLIQKNIPVIPKASTKNHLLENRDIFDFSLSTEELRQLDGLNQNRRFCGEGDPVFDY